MPGSEIPPGTALFALLLGTKPELWNRYEWLSESGIHRLLIVLYLAPESDDEFGVADVGSSMVAILETVSVRLIVNWARFTPLPSGLDAGYGPCKNTWGEPETVSFSCGSRDEVKVCTTCQGFAPRCEGCGGTTSLMKDKVVNTRCPDWFLSHG